MRIGPYLLPTPVILAPMAGITDRPFRQICREFGAGLAVSEMLTADTRLWHTPKSRLRLEHTGETGPISVQIAGSVPEQLAAAAQANVARGADIIDINMGCPAKKVCNRAAGSALLADEALVARILETVVAAVAVPVTLKIRTGPCPATRNAVQIARLAEATGIAALAIHGRTRVDKFQGQAEYETLASVKQSVGIPVVANGDIASAADAKAVLAATGADAVMIGRAAMGAPWLLGEIAAALDSTRQTPQYAPALVIDRHLSELHAFYGPVQGVRIARKHLRAYLKSCSLSAADSKHAWQALSQTPDAAEQRAVAAAWFDRVEAPGNPPGAALAAAA